jgi:TPP-dependent pyruvate/acetoin dehydrogenase alpha subunit
VAPDVDEAARLTSPIADFETNNLGTNGMVAWRPPHRSWHRAKHQMWKADQVCLVIFGNGAANEGSFHESHNLAGVWRLPIVYLCQNKQYAMSMAIANALNIEHISLGASADGMPGVARPDSCLRCCWRRCRMRPPRRWAEPGGGRHRPLAWSGNDRPPIYIFR